jgi:hypothetical protein
MQIDAHTRPVHTVRWLNFRGLLRQRGLTVTAAAGLLDKTQGQISHFGGKRPSKPIGDQIAGEIEAAFGLPHGWLDEHNSGEGTVNERPGGLPSPSQFETLDDATLTQAEEWVRFEEGTRGKYQPVIRLRRLMHFVGLLVADGGRLSPAHAAEVIDAARQSPAGGINVGNAGTQAAGGGN